MASFEAIVFNTRRDGETTLAKAEQVALTPFGGGGGVSYASISPDAGPRAGPVTTTLTVAAG